MSDKFEIGDEVNLRNTSEFFRQEVYKDQLGTCTGVITYIDKNAPYPYKVTWTDAAGIERSNSYRDSDLEFACKEKHTIIDDAIFLQDSIIKGASTHTLSVEEIAGWSNKHYDFKYHLTEKDIENGFIKIDPYFVNMQWGLNAKESSGALFHNLKTIARFGDKNTIEREIKALYNQTKRMAELHNVTLD